MKLDVISYHDLHDKKVQKIIERALLEKGIVGVKDVPEFESKSQAYVNAAREFSAMPENTKQQYTPDRDAGITNGYELGAERFQTKSGEWKIDNNKASYYADVPDTSKNTWPVEAELKSAFLSLGELIFNTAKQVLHSVELNAQTGLNLNEMQGYGRMLHYHKDSDTANSNPDWCGGHFDHGVFTGLMPAYYFCDGVSVSEPEEAGLYIKPSDSHEYIKFDAANKSVLLFQVGEFGQLLSDDRVKATQHRVQKARGGIERFAFALFCSAGGETRIKSKSVLVEDDRYASNQHADGGLTYSEWQIASYARYRVVT